MKYFLDTNICVYYLKGQYRAIKANLLSKHPDEIKIPVVTKAELLYGAEKSKKKSENRQKILEFLLPFEIVPFTDGDVETYATIRNELETAGRIIGPNDLLIASIVLSNDGVLVTNNQKEFANVKTLSIENWLE